MPGLEIGRLANAAPVDLVIGPGQEIWAHKRKQDDEADHEDRQHRRLVPRQPPDGVLRQRAALGCVERFELARILAENSVLASNAGHQRYLTLGSSHA
ncbi:hypothetical protein D3C87_1661430 [compost metagenome]